MAPVLPSCSAPRHEFLEPTLKIPHGTCSAQLFCTPTPPTSPASWSGVAWQMARAASSVRRTYFWPAANLSNSRCQNSSHSGECGTRPLPSVNRVSSSSIRRRRLALPDFRLISPPLLGRFHRGFQLRQTNFDLFFLKGL